MRYIIHHNDADGFGAAYSAFLKFGYADTKYIPIDYGWPFPELEDGSEVYILDFSVPRDLLDQLCSRMSKVQILDHHKSAKIRGRYFSSVIAPSRMSSAFSNSLSSTPPLT